MSDTMDIAADIEALTWICRVVLGATFLVSGVAKLRDVAGFVAGALAYDVLPPRIARPLAYALPIIEVALGGALVASWATRVTAALALLLVLVFGTAVGVSLYRGRLIYCYCMGASSRELIGGATLVRLILLAVAATVVAQEPGGSLWSGVASVEEAMPLLSLATALAMLLFSLGPLETLGHGVIVVWRARRRQAARAIGGVPS